jgi:phosphate uptake regulator
MMSNADSASTVASVLQSMTLLATLSTAENVRSSVAQRRAGLDPSAQEPSGRASASLRTTGRELMDLLMQVVLGHMHLVEQDERPIAVAVRHFDLLMKLRRSERLLHNMHQRLLSLYPNVSESLVEEARAVHGEIERLIEADEEDLLANLDTAAERAISFVVWVRHEV